MIELVAASIVILANHLPSILTPTWINEKKVIDEKPKQSVSTPPFSLFESEHYIFTIDPIRLQLSTKPPNDKSSLKHIPEALAIYIDNFKGLNYKALGLNFTWQHKTDQKEQYDINTQIQYSENKIDLKTIFDGHMVKLGSIAYAEKSPYRLRLIIEPADEFSFKYDFNYNYDTLNLDTEVIKGYLGSFTGKYKHSKSIVQKILGGKDE